MTEGNVFTLSTIMGGGGTPILPIWEGGYPSQVRMVGGGTPCLDLVPSQDRGGGWGDGGCTPSHPRSGQRWGGVPPIQVRSQVRKGGGYPQLEQHGSRRYTSCVHVGGLSC